MRFEPVLNDPRDDPADDQRRRPAQPQQPAQPQPGQPPPGQPPQPWHGRPDAVTSITPPLGPNGIPGETAPHDNALPAGRHNWPLIAPVSAVPITPPVPTVPPVPGIPVPPRLDRPVAPRTGGAVRPARQPGAAPPTLPAAVPTNGHRPAAGGGPANSGPPTGGTATIGSGPPRPRTDFALVRELRRELSTRLTRWQRGREFTIDEEDVERARIAIAVVAEYADQARRAGTPLTAHEERMLLDQVTAELVGLGRLQTLLVDDTIEEVHILGCDQVRITRRSGQVDWHDPIADSDDELVEILQAAARRAGATERSLSTSKPTLDLQLPDGSRLAAVYLVSHRPYAVIRKHNTLDISLDDVAGGRADLDEMIDVLIRDFLRASMRAGLNIMVAGLAGAGKTTIIRALMNEIPADEPYVLLEESRELLPARRTDRHRAVMSFEAREGHGERGFDGRPAGEVSIADLIPVSLRMGVLRIIVGEVRSREIVPMLQAMTTSRGSMCTIHARTPSGVGERIVELALSHGREMTVDQARRMAGNALDLIVYVAVDDETGIGGRKHRFISHIEEVIGVGEGGRISTTTVFGPGPDGRAIPRHLPERVREQLLRIGYDVRGLTRYIEAGVGGWRRPKHSVLRGHR
ncbi:CpaF family protein [Micromonospora sp. LOL_023]|uniref:CpaF family protein n=1 Tax=Micromonospora sp. LOL_023 TaxID=3345418 RepID=UPI003A8C678E